MEKYQEDLVVSKKAETNFALHQIIIKYLLYWCCQSNSNIINILVFKKDRRRFQQKKLGSTVVFVLTVFLTYMNGVFKWKQNK